jgi:hypothetical protein
MKLEIQVLPTQPIYDPNFGTRDRAREERLAAGATGRGFGIVVWTNGWF